MKKINYTTENLEKVFLISLITFFIFLTRGSHLLTSFSLPDASFVLFFAGGIFLKDYKWLCYFLIFSLGIDLLSPPPGLENSYLFNLGYVGLLLSYFVSWFLGIRLNKSSMFSFNRFLWIGSIFISCSYLISTLSFYYLSGWEVQEGITSSLGKNSQEFFIINIAYLLILFVLIKFFHGLFKRKLAHKYE